MNIFQRITATFSQTVSNVVSNVENHDAIVEAVLKESHAAAAKARVRHARLKKDGEHMRRKLAELETMESTWAMRAVASAGKDEAKALECVKRRNICRQQAAQTREALARHDETEREVGASVTRIEQRIESLAQQRNTMRSRHSAADALRVINRIEDNSAHGIEDIFDRWEMKIAEAEYITGATPQSDPLDSSFAKQEDQEALKAELELLLSETAHANKE